MNLYKFRPLTCEKDYDRIVDIIENGFWCSKFSELNDIEEGVFDEYFVDESSLTSEEIKEKLKTIYSEKMKTLVCSFSGLKNDEKLKDKRLLWGYYASGFKGIAIEVKISNDDDVYNVEYSSMGSKRHNDIVLEKNVNIDETIKKILTKKNKAWVHETEARFIKVNARKRKYKIGEITKIYFGKPYGNFINKEIIIENTPILEKYFFWEKQLKEYLKKKEILTDDEFMNL